jgi:hypothetical protein
LISHADVVVGFVLGLKVPGHLVVCRSCYGELGRAIGADAVEIGYVALSTFSY